MTVKSLLLAVLTLMPLAACISVPPPSLPPLPVVQSPVGGPALLGEVSRVSALSPEQRRREVGVLESEHRLDDAKRFQLAALLEREDNPEALEHSLKILAAMDLADPRAQSLLELMKKSLRARIELRQQTARAQELQDKLDQIKALEKSLQQRSTPPRKP